MVLVFMSIPNVYGQFMDDMDKMYNGHPWVQQKQQISKMIVASPSCVLLVQVIYDA